MASDEVEPGIERALRRAGEWLHRAVVRAWKALRRAERFVAETIDNSLRRNTMKSEPTNSFFDRFRRTALAFTGLCFVVLGWRALQPSRDDVLKLQLDGHDVWTQDWVPSHLAWDGAFIVVYTAFAWQILRWRWSKQTDSGRYRKLVLALPFLVALADIAEDALILSLHHDPSRARAIAALHTTARVKWFLVGAVIVAMLWQFRNRVPRPVRPNRAIGSELLPSSDAPQPKASTAQLQPEWMTDGRGICLSGGGIRSAAFSMGALHGLGQDTVQGARYLAAVSGGAFTASAMTYHHHLRAAGTPARMPFEEGSPELRRLRARSSFLFLDGRDGRFTIGRALAALILNGAILYLLMFAVARPAGWAIGYIHPELRAQTPLVDHVTISDPSAPVVRPGAPPRSGVDCGEGARPARYWSFVVVNPGTVTFNERTSPSSGEPTQRVLQLGATTPGLIRSCGAELSVITQPTVALSRSPLTIDQQQTFDVDGSSALFPPTAESVAMQLDVDEELSIGATSPVTERSNISFEAWMWTGLIMLLAVTFMVFALPWGLLLGSSGATMRHGFAQNFWPIAASSWGLGLFVVPWLAQEFPRLLEDLPNLMPGAKTPADSAVGTSIAWLVSLLTSGVLARVATSWLAKPAARVKRGSRFLVKALSYVVLNALGLVVIVMTANQAALNGPGGKGIGAQDAGGGLWYWTTDLANWTVIVLVLLFVKEKLAAHVWSLNPLYRDRLAAAFMRDRDDGKIPEPVHFDSLPYQEGRWPELMVCCAANLKDAAADLPAKRWADSMIFSASHVGAPTLGYLDTSTYEAQLSRRRRRDLSVESIVAVSGAAFSPAMGNQDFGPVGGLFAALNLRLGLWLPNPLSVRHPEQPPPDGWWNANAGWPHLLKELFGRFSYGDAFVYTTDGGHWENLGLVELLRHGCNEIIVLSAAGDGVNSFGTLGDAMALTQEQTGVMIHLDPSPSRPRQGEDLPTSGRQLLRVRDGDDVPEPMASEPFAIGWFVRPGGARGVVLFVEAALTANTPFDVHAFAESHPIFPDHPTTNQFYSHRTFEAYRALGHFQAKAAKDAPAWTAAKVWRLAGAGDDGGPPPPLTGQDTPPTRIVVAAPVHVVVDG